MKLLQAVGDFFALDIGTSALRIAQLHNSGNNHTLARYGVLPLENSKIAMSDAPEDQRKLGEMVKQLVTQSVSTSNVVVGVPTNRMFATVIDVPKMSTQELAGSIKYQAEQYIPQSLDDAKVDWALLGQSPADKSKDEVLIVSVANKYIEGRLDMLENIGLNVVGMEPDSVALARSMLPGNTPGAYMIIDIGEMATDVLVVLDNNPRLIRSIPVGSQSFIKSATQILSVDNEQAKQFVYKFGLAQDKLEGQIYKALENTLQNLVSELQKSIKFFNSRYANQPVSQVIMTGTAAQLPLLDKYLSAKLGVSTSRGNVWQNVSYSANVQDQLMQLNDSFGVVVGLAETEV